MLTWKHGIAGQFGKQWSTGMFHSVKWCYALLKLFLFEILYTRASNEDMSLSFLQRRHCPSLQVPWSLGAACFQFTIGKKRKILHTCILLSSLAIVSTWHMELGYGTSTQILLELLLWCGFQDKGCFSGRWPWAVIFVIGVWWNSSSRAYLEGLAGTSQRSIKLSSWVLSFYFLTGGRLVVHLSRLWGQGGRGRPVIAVFTDFPFHGLLYKLQNLQGQSLELVLVLLLQLHLQLRDIKRGKGLKYKDHLYFSTHLYRNSFTETCEGHREDTWTYDIFHWSSAFRWKIV